jgi:hypothetical protein
MTYSTAANDQVTDAVTQNNLSVLGESPAVAIANQMLATSHSLAMLAANSVSDQSHSRTVQLSSIVQSINSLNTTAQSMSDMAEKISKLEKDFNEGLKNIGASIAKLLEKKTNPYS